MDMITYAKAKKYADKVAATGGNTELIESLVTEEVTKVVTQSDWEQNDETALSFIKNKPFGKTDEFIETEIYNTIMTSYSGIIQSGGPALELGHTYKLVFGTHEFIAEARQEDGWFGVGYLLAFYNPLPDDMPFCYIDMSSGIGLYGIQENLFEPNMSFSIYRIQPKINYLSREYIEEYLVGRKDNIQNYEYKGQTYNSELGAESFNSSTNIAIGSYSHAEGNNTIALGSASHAEGNGSDSIGFYSHAEGIGTESVGNGSHAEGSYTKAIGNSSHAEGLGTEATSNESHAEGWYTVANTPFLHVQGAFNIPEENPTLFGWIRSNLGNQTYDGEKIVYIYNQRPSLNKTTGIITAGETTEKTIKELKVGDYFSFTNNANSIIDSYLHASEFIESEVNSETNNTSYTWIFYSYTDSPRNTQPGKYLHIVGNGTYSDRLSNAHTLEANGTAWFAGDVYVGSTSGVNKDEGSKKLATEEQIVGKKTEGTVVTFEDKEYTCAAGAEIFNDLANKAIGQYSHAEGSGTVAMGLYAHAEGMRSQAIGNFSHAENYSQAPGGYAHSEGSQTVAKGIMSHAEGWLSEASGNQSHVEGHGTVAIASRSHVQGMYNKLDTDKGRTIYASASMGLGENKTFNSNDTVYVLEGNVELNFFTGEITADSLRETLIKDLQVDDFFATTNTNITEYYSLINISKVTETQLTGYCVTMMGVPYENLGKYAHIVGNGGSAHARSNAHTLDWDGNAWYAGSVECTSFILKSSTEGSNKRFRITIDDSGELHTAEIVE